LQYFSPPQYNPQTPVGAAPAAARSEPDIGLLNGIISD
jgi:hypothetical protein